MKTQRDDLISHEDLLELIDYDPFSGVIRWKYRARIWFTTDRQYKTWNKRFAGAIAGTVHNGYRDVRILGPTYKAHRLAWFYCYEKWPSDDIDHVDGDCLNNAIGNLRDIPHKENTRNQRIHRHNKSGVMGVNFHKRDQKYYVYIGARESREHIGVFKTFEEAVKARRAAERDRGFHPYHGRRK